MAVPARETGSTVNIAVEVAAVQAVEAQWAKDIGSRDTDRIIGHYADDAALMMPDSPARIGVAEIRAGLPPTINADGFTMSFKNVKTEISRAGDLAYTRGTIIQSMPGKNDVPQTLTSNYVTIFKKQADGSWKAVEDITSPA